MLSYNMTQVHSVLPWFHCFLPLPVLSPKWSHSFIVLDSSHCKGADGEGGLVGCGKTLQRLNGEAKFVRLESLSLSLLAHNFHFLLSSMQEVKKKLKKVNCRVWHRDVKLQRYNWGGGKNNQKKSHELQSFPTWSSTVKPVHLLHGSNHHQRWWFQISWVG